jgi:hypothetical protein
VRAKTVHAHATHSSSSLAFFFLLRERNRQSCAKLRAGEEQQAEDLPFWDPPFLLTQAAKPHGAKTKYAQFRLVNAVNAVALLVVLFTLRFSIDCTKGSVEVQFLLTNEEHVHGPKPKQKQAP